MNLFPKNPKFFEMFEELTATIVKSATLLSKVSSAGTITKISSDITKLEHHADTICHRLLVEAESTFITPIDREDIHTLAKNLDNVIDLIEEVASKLALYNGVTKITREFHAFTKAIHEATTHVDALVHLLKYRERERKRMSAHIVHIHENEHEGDALIRRSLQLLFSGQKNAITVIKWKDIYETLEEVLDECENVANTVEEVIIKNF